MVEDNILPFFPKIYAKITFFAGHWGGGGGSSTLAPPPAKYGPCRRCAQNEVMGCCQKLSSEAVTVAEVVKHICDCTELKLPHITKWALDINKSKMNQFFIGYYVTGNRE